MTLHARLYGIGSTEYLRMKDYLQDISRENGVGLVLEEISDIDTLIKNKISRIPAIQFGEKIFWNENKNELLFYIKQFIPKTDKHA